MSIENLTSENTEEKYNLEKNISAIENNASTQPEKEFANVGDKEFKSKQEDRLKKMQVELVESESKLKLVNKILDLERQAKIEEEKQIQIIKQKIEISDSTFSKLNLQKSEMEKERISRLEEENKPKLAILQTQEDEARSKVESLKNEARELKEVNFKGSIVDIYLEDKLRNKIDSIKMDIERGNY